MVNYNSPIRYLNFKWTDFVWRHVTSSPN